MRRESGPAVALFGLAVLLFGADLPAQSASFNSAGVEIHYSYSGRGEPVIWLHGWLDDGRQTIASPALRQLARRFQIIAPDLRGHGQSSKPLGGQHYGVEMVRDVVRLLDRLRIRRAHVVGHSMGGMILARLLVDHPQRVRSAVISGSAGIRAGYDNAFVNAFASAVDRGAATGDAIITHWHLTDAGPLDRATRSYLLSLNRTHGRPLAAAAKSWRQLEVSDAQLSQVRVRTLVVRGQHETPEMRRSMAELAQLLPRGVLFDVPRGTHTTTPTRPAYARAVERFLSGTSQP